MRKPPLPSDEAFRLNTLYALSMLDTPADERFDRITRLARRVFKVPTALVSLVDRERQWFKSGQGIETRETPREVSFCGHAILDDEILLVSDARSDERFYDNPLVTGDPYIRFYAGCPIHAPNGARIGTLCLIDQQPQQFEPEDFGLLRDLARMIEEEIAALEIASLDELTGLSNRRGFQMLAGHAFAVNERLQRPVTLIYMDLDGLKQINDKYGHATGDRALVEFAGLLKDSFRDSDVIARLGGDEFVVVTTGSELENAEIALQRFRDKLRNANAATGRRYRLSFSVGSVVYNRQRHDSLATLLSEADQAMYANKNHKRTAH